MSNKTQSFILHPINETFARHSNPIESWNRVGEVNSTFPEGSPQNSPIPGYEAITDDVQKYGKKHKLPIADLTFFEDGTGQRAACFEGFSYGGIIGGTSWEYVLIYDKNNKRIKAVRYVTGYYVM